MIVLIKNEGDVYAYLEQIGLAAGAKAVWYIDEGMDAESRTADYFTNHYEGLVLMVGMYESVLSDSSRMVWDAPQLELTVLERYDAESNPKSLIAARVLTKDVLHKVVGALRRDYEDTFEACAGPGDNGKHWVYKLANNGVMHPVSMERTGVRGWSLDLEIGYPVTEKGYGE